MTHPTEVDSYNQPLTPEGIQEATGEATDAGKLASNLGRIIMTIEITT